IVSSNIGGTATLIGDPPNIMIGSAANFGFMDFIINAAPAVVIIMIAILIVLKFMYGKKLKVDDTKKSALMKLDEKKSIKDLALMKKSIIVIILVIIGFASHMLESSVVALIGAVVMLLIGNQNVDEILVDVEWSSIFFFIGLFVVVGGIEDVGIIKIIAQGLITFTNGNVLLTMLLMLWVSAIVSSIFNNIPFIATMIPLIITLQAHGMDVTPIWWATALGVCLGGNGTLVGASANVVLAGISNRYGYPITFKRYLKFGFPVMILSVVISTIYLLVKFIIL
ncbi:MAG: hypothetical protein LBR30_05880, partial [Clostridioides sp.]|nr:hypothetical protein [Clostridioides sp.]